MSGASWGERYSRAGPSGLRIWSGTERGGVAVTALEMGAGMYSAPEVDGTIRYRFLYPRRWADGPIAC
jgi:hypothetical protein